MRPGRALLAAAVLVVPAFVSITLAPLACSRRGEIAAPFLIRLAEEERIEDVSSPVREVVRHAAPLERTRPPFDERRTCEDWSWFLVANAFGDGPLLQPPSGDVAGLGHAAGGVRVPRGLGVAASLPADRRAVLELEFEGDFDREGGLAVSVSPLDVPPVPLERVVRPGRLRSLHRRHGVGSVVGAEATDDPRVVRVRLRPVAAAKSVLVLVSMHGASEARLERMRARWLTPFEALLREGRISDRFVAVGRVDGEVRPSIALTPGTVVTTGTVEWPDGARLIAHAGGVLGPTPEAPELLVERLDLAGAAVPLLELALPLPTPRWTRVEVELGRAGGGRLRFSFRCEGAVDDVPLLFVGAPRIVSPPRDATNLLVVSLDTVRADRLSAYGQRRDLTPHLDRLAAEGTVFENAYSNAPFTLPSHVTLFTGLLPEAHGVLTFRDRVPSAAPWLPEELASLGYDTAAYTSGGFVGRAFGFGRGFDVYCEVDPIGDRYFPGRAIHNRPFLDGSTGAMPRVLDWLERRGGRPWFLFLHTYMAHDYLPPKDLAREFGLLAEGEPPLSYAAIDRFGAQHVAKHGLEGEDRRRLVDAYDATVKACDAMVGEVLAKLEEEGLLERTIVVVTSDHGEELLDHGGTGHGITLHEEIVRVPLVVRVPHRGAGQRIAARVSLVDLAPTLLELLGATPPASMEGESFASAFEGIPPRDRTVVLGVDDPPRSVREGVIENGWKLLRADDDPSLVLRPAAPRQVFHLASDPGELRDRLGERPEVESALASRLSALRAGAARHREALEAASGSSDAALTPELEARLRELGYLGGE